MKLSEIYQIADSLAPKALSDEYCAKYGAYDNSGILLDTGEEIRSAVVSLDLSFQAIEKDLELGANLSVTHHPAIYGKIGSIRVSDFEPLGEKLARCLKNGISVISMHLNLDCAEDGIDDRLAEGIRKAAGGGSPARTMQPLERGGYGKAYDVAETPLETLVGRIKKEFKTERVLVYGDGERKIGRVASFCGAGADEQTVAFAAKEGTDAVVSSDFKHHVIALALERGLCVVALTHYASENYGFEKYYQSIRQRISVPCEYVTDENLL